MAISACNSDTATRTAQVDSVELSQCFNEKQRNSERDKVLNFINNSNYCNTDSDCKLLHLGCPFGCGTGISSVKENEVLNKVKSYRIKSCVKCRNKCGFKPTTVKCIENKCSGAITPHNKALNKDATSVAPIS